MGITTSSPSTYSRVTPYLSARGPPAFSATLPPMVQSVERVGIGRVEEPVLLHLGLEHAGDHPRLQPGGEVGRADLEDAVHPLHRDRRSRRGWRASRPTSRCAPPIGTTGTRWREAMAKMARTSSADSTFTTTSGREDAQVRLVLAVLGEPLRVEDQPLGREGGAQLPRRPPPSPGPAVTRTPPRRSRSWRPAPPRRTSPPPAPRRPAAMAGGNGVCASMRGVDAARARPSSPGRRSRAPPRPGSWRSR